MFMHMSYEHKNDICTAACAVVKIYNHMPYLLY